MAAQTFLIVDDEYTVSTILAEELRGFGWTNLRIAHSAEEAIVVCKTFPPSLVIVDIHLRNNIDGIELVSRLRQEGNPPVIFITGDRSPATFNRAAKLHPVGYITKPIDSYQLWTTIQIALSSLKANKKLARSNRPKKPVNVFISYSHCDKAYFEELQTHLQALPVDRFDIWDDTRLLPGYDWKRELFAKLSCAKIGIMLLSADYLASEFITRYELPALLRAAERDGTLILYAIVRPCRVPQSVARFQAMNHPRRALSELRVPARERVWVALADLIEGERA